MNPLSAAAGNVAGPYMTASTVPEPVSARVGTDAPAVKAVDVPVKPDINLQEVTRPSREATEVAARQIQRFVSSMQRQVNVSKDELTGYISVQIVNPETGEVIRTLPSDELLRIARSFEQLGSTMVNQKA